MDRFYKLDQLLKSREASGRSYLEFLRVPAMSAGIYVLAKGATDQQKPHSEDEIYYVIQGRARMHVGSEHSAISAGSVIFVGANTDHKFYDIEEELVILVLFAPAEQS